MIDSVSAEINGVHNWWRRCQQHIILWIAMHDEKLQCNYSAAITSGWPFVISGFSWLDLIRHDAPKLFWGRLVWKVKTIKGNCI